jgi:hypothetical protein
VRVIQQNDKPVNQIHYLIGIGRSGTTLLTNLLNSHTHIKAIPEIPIALFFNHNYKKLNCKNEELERFMSEYLTEIQKIRPKEIVDMNVDNMRFTNHYSSYREFVSYCFSNIRIFGIQKKCPIIIDKNPIYTFYTKELRGSFPEAKFIILTRDYRANIHSRKKKKNDKSTSVFYNAWRWRKFHNRISKIASDPNVIVVKYEELVFNPESVIRQICDFLKVTFEPEMLNAPALSPQSFYLQKSNLESFMAANFSLISQGVSSSKVDSWKYGLTEDEIAIADQVCSRIGSQFGYSGNSTKRNFLLYFLNLKFIIIVEWEFIKDYIIYLSPIRLKLQRFKQSIERVL